MESVYTPREIAEILKVKISTVTRHLRNGSLRGFKVGNHWRVKETALKEFMGNYGESEDVTLKGGHGE